MSLYLVCFCEYIVYLARHVLSIIHTKNNLDNRITVSVCAMESLMERLLIGISNGYVKLSLRFTYMYLTNIRFR